MPERLTWDEMVKKYPGHWLVLVNVKYEDGSDIDIAEADVVQVLDDYVALDKMAELEEESDSYTFCRTTSHSDAMGGWSCLC